MFEASLVYITMIQQVLDQAEYIMRPCLGTKGLDLTSKRLVSIPEGIIIYIQRPNQQLTLQRSRKEWVGVRLSGKGEELRMGMIIVDMYETVKS